VLITLDLHPDKERRRYAPTMTSFCVARLGGN
jgi:hypothetical protein